MFRKCTVLSKFVVGLLFVFSCSSISSKIYDCFLFLHEYEVLKIRLEELYDHVDYFVLVESAETFRGKPKPFNFEENKSKFEKYLNKIIHVKIPEKRPDLTAWERESFQRNCIQRGLQNCHRNDVILISDLDEIPRNTTIPKIKKLLSQGKFGVVLEEKIYFFQLNLCTANGLSWDNNYWFGTVATSFKELSRYSPQFFREQGRKEVLHKIFNGGWHFTYMGDVESVKVKLDSFSHGSDKIAEDYTPDQHMQNIKGHHAVPVDETFPKYVRENLSYYKSMGFIANF